MDVDDEDPQQQQQQKKSTSKLLLFRNREKKKKKNTSPYPGGVPVWHAGEFFVQDTNDDDNSDRTTTTTTTGSNTSSTTTRSASPTIRDTTNMHKIYISEITAASGHYLLTKKHIYWFQVTVVVVVALIGIIFD